MDGTNIAAAPSTKNEAHARDLEMHQPKWGDEWHYGMKAHVGAEAQFCLVKSLHTTSANDSDVINTDNVLHGQQTGALLEDTA